MTSKEAIFEALKAARPEVFEKPDLSEVKSLSLRYEDPLAQFCEAVKGSGGKVLRIEAGDSPEEAARSLFPDADDICIAKGVFGVAENGCVYLEEPTDMPRVKYFISDTLVLVIDEESIVANMHDAYDRLGEEVKGYGIFISGPSKTADIEQALVFGAHGARSVGVLLRRRNAPATYCSGGVLLRRREM